jgi:hypothetical protein
MEQNVPIVKNNTFLMNPIRVCKKKIKQKFTQRRLAVAFEVSGHIAFNNAR